MAAGVTPFRAAGEFLADLDAKTTATLLTAAADIALIVDNTGVICDLAFGNDELVRENYSAWLGRPWLDTVTVESRPKVEALCRDAVAHAPLRKRQVNHPSPHGADVPVLYSAIQVGPQGRIIAVGRELRALAVLQQRLVDAQQAMERDYGRLRHLETRYRLLFQLASEAVLIVDAATRKVIEANPAAARLFGDSGGPLLGQTLASLFAPASQSIVQELLAGVRGMGRTDEVRVSLNGDQGDCLVSVSLFRQDDSSQFLVQLTPRRAQAANEPAVQSPLLRIIAAAPEGFVVTDPQGRILLTNAAFLDLAQLATEEQARHESLDRWLGRPGVDLNVLLASLREHGVVRLFASTLHGEYGANAEVELSAVAVPHGEPPCCGFMIRNISPRLPVSPRPGRELPRSVEQLTELVGRVPLRELVRETTDLIERFCIEAALELTGDNRAAAADMLGLSRQSLYVKLRRYGLADPAADDEKR